MVTVPSLNGEPFIFYPFQQKRVWF